MFYITVTILLMNWIIFYIYYRSIKKIFEKEENIINGIVVKRVYATPFIKRHIVTVKINENGQEKLVNTNCYGDVFLVPDYGRNIKLIKRRNNKYENNYNFDKLKMYYTCTIIAVPVAIVIAIVLKILL